MSWVNNNNGTTPGRGIFTDCNTVPLWMAMTDSRVYQAVRALEEVTVGYRDGNPGIVIENKLTRDNCIFVKIVSTFKFPL